MPQYAGNLVANPQQGLISDNNYRTSPNTRFGTRQLQRLTVYTSNDILTDYLASNSLYSQLVRALQQNVELYEVSMPNPSFFNCYGENAFSITIAYDTANDYWNATNSFIDDGDPVNWYYGYTEGTDTGIYNINALMLIDVVNRALSDAGQSTDAWVSATWTVGDMTWPSNGTTVPGGAAPESVRRAFGAKPATVTPQAANELSFGDSAMTRLRKIANWLKTLNP
jgi:hypothetical protein